MESEKKRKERNSKMPRIWLKSKRNSQQNFKTKDPSGRINLYANRGSAVTSRCAPVIY